MGSCLSKKKKVSNSKNNSAIAVPDQNTCSISKPPKILKPEEIESETRLNLDETKQQQKELAVKKDIFVIKHRSSYDAATSTFPPKNQQEQQNEPEKPLVLQPEPAGSGSGAVGMVGVRTSSCTKEEVDAILIQCGRLSRSSSAKASASCDRGGSCTNKYSGSKRSYDFDNCDNKEAVSTENDDDDDREVVVEKHRHHHHHRQRHRQSSTPSPSKGRRRTPSRERERDGNQHQRSRSHERRVSRSPGRRSSDTTTTNNTNAGSRPGKMVSVPATVSSLAMEKRNNGDLATTTSTVKRISVKRNVGIEAPPMNGSSRIDSSPRSHSPARTNVASFKHSKENQSTTLSRNSSRKAEKSPCRRNPLSEIDQNSSSNNNNKSSSSNKVQNRNTKEVEREDVILKESTNALNQITGRALETQKMVEAALDEEAGGNPKPQPLLLTRSRSTRQSRGSRELDISPEALLNPKPASSSYTSLLLEDINNFHQKNNNNNIINSVVSLPPSVTKACSILEAVADLNSTTSSNLSCEEDRRRSPPTTSSRHSKRNDHHNNNNSCGVANHSYNPLVKNNIMLEVEEIKEPFEESELIVGDDVMEPSIHKYVTVQRGGNLKMNGLGLDRDMEDQESSGSNSFVGFSSSWEPNSADSATDCCWTSSSSGSLKRNMDNKSTTRRMVEKQRDCGIQQQQSGGIGRGRLLGSSSRTVQTTPDIYAAAAST